MKLVSTEKMRGLKDGKKGKYYIYISKPGTGKSSFSAVNHLNKVTLCNYFALTIKYIANGRSSCCMTKKTKYFDFIKITFNGE